MAGRGDALARSTAYNWGMTSAAASIGIGVLSRGERATVAEVFAGLGERSRRLRFAGPKPSLAPRELDYLADVDGDRHMAVVAREAGGLPIGIARWVRDGDDHTCAEIAVAVVDDWQSVGVGSQLLAALAGGARDAGLTRFRASVSCGNEPVFALLRKLGTIVGFEIQSGLAEVVVEL
jgi:ribosomal protein S18 acetylase RimI-like enzyme